MNVTAPSKVRMLFADGVCEEVRVTFVGNCLCRLEQTPLASATDARLGDVVEFDPEDGIAKMLRVVERSRLEMLTWNVGPEVLESSRFADFTAVIERDGGRVEHAFGGTVLVHVLPGKKAAVEQAFDAIRSTR